MPELNHNSSLGQVYFCLEMGLSDMRAHPGTIRMQATNISSSLRCVYFFPIRVSNTSAPLLCNNNTGKAFFVSDIVDPTPFLQEMNGDAIKSYLDSL